MAQAVQRRIEERWQLPFWTVVRQMANQGLCKLDVCRALGLYPKAFYAQLNREPHKDPFPLIGPSAVVSAWVKDTGEPFGKACKRMASEGLTVSRAAAVFGFTSKDGLRRAMRDRGIKVSFPPRKAQPVLYFPSRKAPTKWRVRAPGFLGWYHSEVEARKAAKERGLM